MALFALCLYHPGARGRSESEPSAMPFIHHFALIFKQNDIIIYKEHKTLIEKEYSTSRDDVNRFYKLVDRVETDSRLDTAADHLKNLIAEMKVALRSKGII